MKRLLAMAAVVMMAQASARGAEDVRGLLEEAGTAYAEGARRLSSDREGALGAFARSAVLYKRVAGVVGGNASPALMYNIGNASMLSGNLGDAVLWYKRAERLAPNDPATKANLTTAREKIASAASVKPRDSVLRQLTIIEFVPASVRFWTAVAGFGAMSTLMLWRVWSAGWRPSRVAVGVCGVIGVVAAASLAPREMRLRETGEAVVRREVTGRAGPDAGAYEAKPASPLKPGTEVVVMEERGGWVLVELGDGTTSWLEAKGIERVNAQASRATPVQTVD